MVTAQIDHIRRTNAHRFRELPKRMRWCYPNMVRGLADMCSMLPPDAVGVEIGCFAGESTTIMLESGVAHLHCVDLWDPDWQPGWWPKTKNVQKSDRMVLAEATFDKLVSDYSDRITKVKMNSRDALAELKPQGPFDFVYIDADHSYEAVLSDIDMALRLIHPSGIICGHDISQTGVFKAVRERLHGVDVRFSDDSWLRYVERI